MKSAVLIIGYGEIGQAISRILGSKGVEISSWDKDPKRNTSQKELAELLPTASIIFLCIPSFALKEILDNLKNNIQPGSSIIVLTKGINKETGLTVDLLIEKILGPNQSFGLLAGPMIAEELMAGKNGYCVISSTDKKLQSEVMELFEETILIVSESSDVHGTAVASVLKNIYSIALGIVDGLGLGSDVSGKITEQALKEMAEIITNLGGQEKTAYNLAGLGDLVATGFSQDSANHKAGCELAITGKIKSFAEGVDSLPSLINILKEKTQNYPLLNSIKSAVINGKIERESFRLF